MKLVAIGLSAGVLSLLISRLLIQLAVKYQIVDIVNERSLHSEQTPRGGGFALLVVFAIFGLVMTNLGGVFSFEFVLYLGIAITSAILGLVDDIYSLGVLFRLGCQALIASAFAYLAVNLRPEITVSVLFLAAMGFVWSVNGTNFMDGADGLLPSQAALIFITLAYILTNSGSDIFAILALVLSSSCIGFLCLNWEPASIFLGDVGSYFIGAQTALFALYIPSFGISPYVTLILITPLLADATFTLITRIFRRRPFWRAHREHVYQLWILNGVSHGYITTGLFIINISLFTPLAFFCWKKPQFGQEMFFGALVLALALWSTFRFRALRAQS